MLHLLLLVLHGFRTLNPITFLKSEMEDAPPAKRSRKSLDRSQDRSSPLVVDDSPVSPPDDAEVRVFGADLVIYDRHRRCLLTDGDYELVLKDMGQPESPKKQATWETVCDGVLCRSWAAIC